MQSICNFMLTGKSGKTYRFDVYPKNIQVGNVPALYAFLKRRGNQFSVLYIGKTTDLAERLSNHHKWEEATRYGFEYLAICLRVQARSLDADEADLIQQYLPRCNEVVPR